METDSDKYHAFRGVRKTEDGAMFGFALPSEYRQARRWRPETPAYLLLFRRDEEKPFCRIRLDSHIKQGTYSCIRIRDPELSACRYAYEVDGNIVPDPYGTSFTGCSCFGEAESGTVTSSLSFLKDPETFDWKGDRHPRTPFDDSVFYKLHVRGFTKSETSGVPEEERGTFAGLIRKIPHIVSLGVTAVELMPAYEFDECRRLTSGGLQKNLAGVQQEKPQLNFWGYVPAFGYFAPKAAYCADKSEHYADEFRTMVRRMHKAGLEVILEMYFADEEPGMVLDCLHYWVDSYHVDGFHLYASQETLAAAVADPYLADTKLITVWWDRTMPKNRHVASYNDGCRQVMRRFLKGDDGQIRPLIGIIRDFPERCARINSVTSHDGFTLADLYSYDHKHNENGGEAENYSWNCGVEGPTRKRSVLTLRRQMRENAVLLLMLMQGAPLLRAGDEFLNSQDGNNNPYDIDSEVSWVNWNKGADATRMLRFTREAVALRKAHKILHMDAPLSGSDTLAIGCPDFSLHGENAWFTRTDESVRQIGLMFCETYADPDSDALLYAALNMYWEPWDAALPDADRSQGWRIVISDSGHEMPEISEDQRKLTVPPRSICILEGHVRKESNGGRNTGDGQKDR